MKQVNGKRVFKLTGYVEMAPRYVLNGRNNIRKDDYFILKVAVGGVVLPDRICAKLEPNPC